MGLRERWSELSTGTKVLVGAGIGIGVFVVAIPVLLILAAVVGSFVLGMGGGDVPDAPTASIEYEYEGAGEEMTATITHEGGEPIESGNLAVRINDRTVSWTDEDGEIGVGNSITVDVAAGDSIRVVWDDGSERVTLSSDEVPR
jgi:FlaG/FlaF family flagellin (archaellin)